MAAEGKGSLFTRSVQKHAGRAKEKFLQNLGKVDRTSDGIFEEYLTNFNRQQTNANRLQKEFNNYIRCIRAVQNASKSLMEAISEVYESQWTGADALNAQMSAIDVLWQDFSHKLGDQVLIPLNTYTAQFPDMKKKIEKRNRKLLDYDSQRHSFESLQASAAKRKDDVKVTKGREQLEEARRTFEMMNSELYDELPALYDSRILFLVTNLQTLFASEQVFHHETDKIYGELEAIVDKLATESQRGSYSLKRTNGNARSNPSSPPQSPLKAMANSTASINNSGVPPPMTNGNSHANSLSASTSSPSSSPVAVSKVAPPTMTTTPDSENNNHAEPATIPTTTTTTTSSSEPAYMNTTESVAIAAAAAAAEVIGAALEENNNRRMSTEKAMLENGHGNKAVEEVDGVPKSPTRAHNMPAAVGGAAAAAPVPAALSTGAIAKEGITKTDLPPGVLYRVQATYRYDKEDADELSFEVGETICVIEYTDPEDQEEGWLMGQKENNGERGLFPANFTRPL